MNTTMRMKAIPYEPAPAPQEGVMFEQLVTVKRIVMTSAMLMVFTLMALGYSTAHGGVSTTWHSDFASARRQSQKLDKPMFVMLARTGCHACSEMEQNLSNSASRRALSGAVKVRLETSDNPAMAARYAAGGTPTTVIFAPGNYTSPVYTYTGAMDIGTIIGVGRSMNSMN